MGSRSRSYERKYTDAGGLVSSSTSGIAYISLIDIGIDMTTVGMWQLICIFVYQITYTMFEQLKRTNTA